MTVLVETPVAVEAQAETAARLMALEPAAEQVGFLSEAASEGSGGADIALRMAGGEFCGNATMSAAVLAAQRRGETGDTTVLVEASGAPEPVAVALSRQPDGSWQGTLHMPRPVAAKTVALPLHEGTVDLPLVSFDGIDHLILEREAPLSAQERAEAEGLIRTWQEVLGAEALGLMFYERDAGVLTPLVYVPAAGTLCWENACASGSCGVAVHSGEEYVRLAQPGGTLEVRTSRTGELSLTGTVRTEKTETVDLS